MFYFKNIPLKRKTYLERHKKTKMEDSRGEIIFSEGHLIKNIRLYYIPYTQYNISVYIALQ